VLNKKEDYEYFKKRALNYRNVWDDRVGFMGPKSEDDEWVLHRPRMSSAQSGPAARADGLFTPR